MLVAARSVGVCHSDIDLLEGRYIIPFSYPIIPGHEWSGEVVQVGSKVTELDVGDRVVGECVIGDDHFGFSISGAAAEFFVAKASWLHRLPEGISWTMGALVEPFSVAYYALVRAGGVDASNTVAVLGAGPISLAAARGVECHGRPDRGRGTERRAPGGGVTAGRRPPVEPEGAEEFLRELTEGRGADVVLEASGRPAVMASALELVAFQGRIAYIGIDVGQEAPAKLGLIQSKELRITGSIGSPGVWQETLRFLAGSGLDLTPLVTDRFNVDQALAALDTAHHPTPATIKAHIEFDGTL